MQGVSRRDVLTFVLALPFVAAAPYLLPPHDAGWARPAMAAAIAVIGLLAARAVAIRVTC